MKKDVFKKFTKEEQTDALKELQIVSKEARKERKWRFLKILFCLIFLIALFKSLIGSIELENPFEFEKNRFYEITFNGKPVNVWAEEVHRQPLIPYFIYFNSWARNVYHAEEEPIYEFGKEKQYILKINSYDCYDKNLETRVKCEGDENHLKEANHDTIYELRIRKTEPDTPTEYAEELWKTIDVYQGPFIEDITKYIDDKEGRYTFIFTGKYGKVIADLNFWLDYKNNI